MEPAWLVSRSLEAAPHTRHKVLQTSYRLECKVGGLERSCRAAEGLQGSEGHMFSFETRPCYVTLAAQYFDTPTTAQ